VKLSAPPLDLDPKTRLTRTATACNPPCSQGTQQIKGRDSALNRGNAFCEKLQSISQTILDIRDIIAVKIRYAPQILASLLLQPQHTM
jgi:hypothetical protein